MYVEGISAAIDAGRWDKLDPDAAIDGFDHAFLLRARGDQLIGRMWSSADGKGRTRYPMVVVAQVTGAPLEWSLPTVLAELEALRARCEAAATAAEVVAAVDASRAALRARAGTLDASRVETALPAAFAPALADTPAYGPGRQGLIRVLYQIDRELAEYLLGSQPASRMGRIEEARTHHLRLPAAAVPPAASNAPGPAGELAARLLTAARLLLAKLEPYAPMLFIAPRARDFVDALVGEPAGAQLFCIRADRKAIPLTSEIPYTIDATYANAAARWIDAQGTGPDREIPTVPPRKPVSGIGRFRAPITPFALALAAALTAAHPAAQVHAAPPPADQPNPAQPRDQYNAALRELRSRVEAPGVSDAAAADAARDFLARAKALPGGIAYLADVAPVLSRIEASLAGSGGGLTPEVLKLGPGSTGLYVGALDERGGSVRFTPVRGVDLPELVFVPIDLPPDAPGQPIRRSFVCTTEVSVGAFGAIVGLQGSTADLRRVLTPFEPVTDPRMGPRSWEWGTVLHRPVVPARSWFAPRIRRAAETYEAGSAPAPPDLATPIQYISPAAALFAARLWGCRLPTSGEWLAVSRTEASMRGQGKAPTANLRDQTWARHAAFVRGSGQAGVFDPAAGIFAPSDAKDSGDVWPQDDGVLWFAPVGLPDTGVQHLVGNVAEFVLDAPDDPLPPGRPGGVTEFVEKHASGLKVIGGSALSAPGLEPARAVGAILGEAREGYSDVGFRIAFSGGAARTRTLAERLHWILDPLPILPER